MPRGTLEHVNISVTDPERTARLFEALCGWRRRWEGAAMAEGRTIHLGSDDGYVRFTAMRALRAASPRVFR